MFSDAKLDYINSLLTACDKRGSFYSLNKLKCAIDIISGLIGIVIYYYIIKFLYYILIEKYEDKNKYSNEDIKND